MFSGHGIVGLLLYSATLALFTMEVGRMQQLRSMRGQLRSFSFKRVDTYNLTMRT